MPTLFVCRVWQLWTTDQVVNVRFIFAICHLSSIRKWMAWSFSKLLWLSAYLFMVFFSSHIIPQSMARWATTADLPLLPPLPLRPLFSSRYVPTLHLRGNRCHPSTVSSCLLTKFSFVTKSTVLHVHYGDTQLVMNLKVKRK